MNKKIPSLLAVGIIGVFVTGTIISTASQNEFASFNARADVNDWNITLNSTTNRLAEGSGNGVFHLHDTNTVAVSYSGYTHAADNWGVLAKDGYFQITGRIGGLSSINYNIDNELKIYFGYQESSKPTYYNAPLPSDLNSFNFPDDKGYPDTFKIVNESDENVVIENIIINYTCSKEDQHVHHSLGEKSAITRTTDPTVKYWDVCDICDEQFEISLNKAITIGTYTYNEYTYVDYNNEQRGPGTLDIDYNGVYDSAQRFVLTLSGDNSDKDLYIDANHDPASQIIVMAEDDAKIGNITFKGGYGVLVFMGSTLTFADGATLDSEAMYTSVKSPLVFNKTDGKSGTAIYVNNGCLTLESDVSISGYESGIKFYQSATGTKDLNQSSGTLNINNCTYGISGEGASYTPKATILGTTNISGCKIGIKRTFVQVGDDTTAGKLMIDVDKTGSTGSDPSIGIDLASDMNRSSDLKFVKGEAAIYSSNTATDWNDAAWGEWGSGSPDTPNGSYTIGIRFYSNDPTRMNWSSSFKFGLGNLARGFDNKCGSDVTSFFKNTGIRDCSALHTYHLVDAAWGLSSKPNSGTNVVTHSTLEDLLSAF